jgi:membrane fusion protein (multidrug efflux system)
MLNALSRLKWKKEIVFFIFFLSVIFGSIHWFFYARFIESTDNAYVRGDVTPLASKVSGYIQELYVDDGEMVTSNMPLVKIEDQEMRERLNKCIAEHEEAKIELGQKLTALKMQESRIKKTGHHIAGAKAEMERAQESLKRSKSLAKTKALSQEKCEEISATFMKAYTNYRAETEQWVLDKLTLDHMKDDHERLKEKIKITQAQKELSKIDFQNSVILAPRSGVIGQRSCKKGQFVRPGSILMYVIALDSVWVFANFKETQVKNMKAGQEAIIKIDAFPSDVFEGKVDSIQPASGAEFSLIPPDNATGNFTKIVQRVPVKIVFKNPQKRRIVPGMSAYVKVLTQTS